MPTYAVPHFVDRNADNATIYPLVSASANTAVPALSEGISQGCLMMLSDFFDWHFSLASANGSPVSGSGYKVFFDITLSFLMEAPALGTDPADFLAANPGIPKFHFHNDDGVSNNLLRRSSNSLGLAYTADANLLEALGGISKFTTGTDGKTPTIPIGRFSDPSSPFGRYIANYLNSIQFINNNIPFHMEMSVYALGSGGDVQTLHFIGLPGEPRQYGLTHPCIVQNTVGGGIPITETEMCSVIASATGDNWANVRPLLALVLPCARNPSA